MEQDKIWNYFQNDGLIHDVFSEARHRFFASHLHAGQVVLNIGIGNGMLERLALAKNVDIHAMDPNVRAIEHLKRELAMGEKAQVGRAQSMPFADRLFDVVIMSEVLEHLDEEKLVAALGEVGRVLKPRGVLMASTPYRENLDANTVVCPDCGKVFHKVGHVQSFDRTRMKALLVGFGYEVHRIRVTTFVDWRRSGLQNLLKSAVRLLLAHMGEGIADPHIVIEAIFPRQDAL